MRRSRRKLLGVEKLEPRDVPAIIPFDATDLTVSNTANPEQAAEVAIRPDGQGFVVAWEAADGGGGASDRGIYFQRYNANWQAVGGAVRANTVTTDIQNVPSVGIDGSGNFVLTWQSYNQAGASSQQDVYARRYAADGTPVDAAEFLVNTGSAGTTNRADQDADVAVNAAGQFVITWSGGTVLTEDVYAKGYTSVTGALTTSFAETVVNDTAASPDDQLTPAVAISPTGSFVVTYISYDQDGNVPPNGNGTGNYGVFARRMNANGTTNGAEFQVSTAVTINDQVNPDVAMDGSGNFVIVWTSPGVDSDQNGIVMQRYSAAGATLGGNTTVNTLVTAGPQNPAKVSRAAGGDYVVTWQSAEADGDGTGTDVYYKKFDSAGGTLISDTLVNTGATASNDLNENAPAVGITTAGDFVVAYETATATDFGVVIRRYGEDPNVAFTAATSSGSEATNASIGLTRTGTQYALANVATTVAVNDAATGTATSGVDYTAFGGNVTFAATPGLTGGTQTASKAITITDDTADEPDETIGLSLSAVSGGAVAGQTTHTYTILDNDPPPTVSVNSPSVAEGNAGTTTLSFTVTLSAASGQTVTVNYATANGTATAGTDYVAASSTLTFAPGVTSQTVNVTVNGDTLFEANETLTVTLSGPTNATLGTATGTGTITNDDTAPTLSINDVTVTEGDSGTVTATFTVTQSAASGATTTVNYATANGTATAGSDYTAGSGTLSFAPGVTSQTVSVTVNGDTLFEANETFFVNLSGATGATIADTQGLGTITDDDAAASLTVVSGNNQSTVVSTAFAAPLVAVVKNAAGNPVQGVTVTFTPPGAGASVTFATPTPVSNASGQVSTGTATANGTAGGPYTVTATATGGTAPSTTFSLTNLPATSFSINDVTVTEGNGGTTLVTFTVTASPTSPGTSTVNYATADGTATTADGDYVAASGTLTFAPGVATQTFTVTVNGDTKFEANETFLVNLSGATGAGISDTQGVATITNDDTAPTLAVNDVTLAEGNAGTTAYTFTVSLSAASGLTTTVNYATADGTATAGTDYTAKSGTLTFAPGVTTQTVTVLANGDTVFEADQTFLLNLSGPTNATILDAQGVGTITNDDAAPTLVINDVSASEAAGTVTFTVTRTGATEVPIAVNYATADGTAVATAGGAGTPDYTAASGTLNIAPSLAATATQTFTVALTNDAVYEAVEQFAANLSAPSGATIADAQGIGTITDDDAAPTLSVDDITVSEAGTATFTVTLTGATALPISVNFATADGTAVSGPAGPGTPDYTAATGTLTFNPSASGTQTLTITVPLADDTTNEPAEQFAVNLFNPTNGAAITDAQGIATVIDDDGVPALSVGDVTLAEGDAGTTAYTFTVTLSAPSGQTVTVNYSTADGTATAGTDYTTATGTLTFAPGVTTQTVTVLANGDTVFENDEAFALNLSAATNAIILDAQAIGTVTNDDAAPTLVIDDVSVSEAGGTVTFTVTRTGATEVPITVDYATADGTAVLTAGGPGTPDYTAASGTLTFAPSLAATATQTFTVAVTDDNVYEAIEQFAANLSNPAAATLADAQGIGTITDDDAAPTFSIDDITVDESGTATFTVTLTGATALPIGADFATVDGTAVSVSAGPGTPDYTLTNGTLTFNPSASGTQTLTITVPLVDDAVSEPAEQFAVNLFNPTNGATITDAQGIATVTDTDALPTISVNDVTQAEGDAGVTVITFTVTLSAPSAQTVTVDYSTADGTAAFGSDYAATSGTLSFAPGVTTQTVTVFVTGDTVYETDETFQVVLNSPTNATIADGQGVGTITNDDAAPTLSIDDVTVNEGAGTITFTVTRTGNTEVASTVDYATGSLTASSTAGAPGTPDFTAASGTLTFAASATAVTQTITVAITDDNVYEAVEQFLVSLSNATAATLADGQGIGTITDDDTAPTISVGDITVNENGTTTFTVTLTGATALPVDVAYATADGTAVSTISGPGTPDYTVTNGTLTFSPSAAGTQTATITVQLVNDTTQESTEQFTLNLSSPTNATITDAQGVATVTDDDTAPTLSVNSVTVAEGNAGTSVLTFTVTLSEASALPVTVAYATADGTATTADGDYQSATGLLTFLPGETTKTVTVTVNGDTTFETDETFTVALSAPTNATLGTASGTGTITNDDSAPTVTLSATGTTVSENGGTTTVTATLSNPSSIPVTVTLAVTPAGAATLSAATITIPAGSLTGSVTLTGVDNTADEADRTATVAITAVANGSAGVQTPVTVTITDDDLPAAVADTATTAEDTPLAGSGLLTNDNAAAGSTVELVGSGPANGTLTLNPDGTYTYTPAANFFGTNSFQYRIVNPAGEASAPATVTITVTPVNDPPSFAGVPNQVVPRDPGPQTVTGFATLISAGPNESGQTLTFTVTADTPALFAVQPAIDANGTLTYTPADGAYGTATVSVRLSDNGGGSNTSAVRTFTITVNKHLIESLPVSQNEVPVFAAGPGDGGPGTVTVYAADGTVAYTVSPFPDGDGTRAVLADVTGDGVPDVVAGTGPGAAAQAVVVIDGATKQSVRTFSPFEARFTGGVFVAAGDFNGDGVADVAVTADTTGGPRVVIYDGKTGAKMADFFGIDDPEFRGGARLAVGDVNADGVADLVVAAGAGGGPRIAVYDGTSLRPGTLPVKLVPDFFAFSPDLRDGSFPAVGDLNGDGYDDLIFGGGPTGGPRVLAYDSKALFGTPGGAFTTLTSFFAGDQNLRDGVRVAAKDLDGDRLADLITSVPTGTTSDVRVILGKNLGPTGGDVETDLDLFPGLATGVYVG